MTEKKDQSLEEIVNDNQSKEKSEKTEEEPITVERTFELAQALQKGYTLTRQELAEVRNNIADIAEAINQQKSTNVGDDEYVTVSKLRNEIRAIFNEQTQNEEQGRIEAENYIDSALTDLKTAGVIKSKEEEEEFIEYAVKIKETDLNRAAELWQEVKQAKEEGMKEAAKTKAKQLEGSKVGTSQKAGSEEQGGVDYAKIKKMDWYSF